jgi:hypothetical protein
MEEANRILCERCNAVNPANAELCRRCGEPLQETAPTATFQKSGSALYRANEEMREPPRNALDELMHLGIGGLISFGVRLGFILAIAGIITLVVFAIIVVLGVIVLTLLGVGIGNLLFGNLTSIAGV